MTGESPLHLAAILGHLDCVKILLENGALASLKTFTGWTPIHYACNSDSGINYEIVEELLAADGDATATIEYGSKHLRARSTALHFAALCNSPSIITLLLDYGAHIDAVDEENNTALLVAARAGNADALNVLLENDADTEIENFQLNQAVDVAEDVKCANLLSDHSATVGGLGAWAKQRQNRRSGIGLVELSRDMKKAKADHKLLRRKTLFSQKERKGGIATTGGLVPLLVE